VAQNAEQVELLAALVGRADDRREAFEARISELTETVSRLAGQLAEARAPTQAQAGTDRQVALLEKIAERLDRGAEDAGAFDGDPEVRGRIRSIDRQLLRLVEEIAAGRQDAVAELRAELNTLGRAVIHLADQRRGG
jgi:chromosome segregation ATPase